MIHPYSHYPARAGRHWPEQVALIDGDRSRTYAELNTNADIIARGLIKLGLEPTERVTLIQRNCIEYVESVIGIARAGGVLVPMLGALTEAEHAFMLNDTEARFIIVMAADDDARALAIAEDPVEVLSFHSAEGVVDLSELDESGDEDSPLIDLPPFVIANSNLCVCTFPANRSEPRFSFRQSQLMLFRAHIGVEAIGFCLSESRIEDRSQFLPGPFHQ